MLQSAWGLLCDLHVMPVGTSNGILSHRAWSARPSLTPQPQGQSNERIGIEMVKVDAEITGQCHHNEKIQLTEYIPGAVHDRCGESSGPGSSGTPFGRGRTEAMSSEVQCLVGYSQSTPSTTLCWCRAQL